jgi:hypothetical protein
MVRRRQNKKTNPAGIPWLLREHFVSNGELCPTEAYRLLKANGHRTSYPATLRLFYDLRQLSLIELTHSEPGIAPIDRRYHRIVHGKENDAAWGTHPHHTLYPASATGGLNYRQGASHGRAKEYNRRS